MGTAGSGADSWAKSGVISVLPRCLGGCCCGGWRQPSFCCALSLLLARWLSFVLRCLRLAAPFTDQSPLVRVTAVGRIGVLEALLKASYTERNRGTGLTCVFCVLTGVRRSHRPLLHSFRLISDSPCLL